MHYSLRRSNQQTGKKQLDIKSRFCSETDSAVKLHHFKTCLMGHATCVLLPEKLSSSLEDNEIPLPLSFESDGPHVIKTV